MRLGALGTLLVLLSAPAAGQEACPSSLLSALASENPACDVTSQGTLRSELGNGAVTYRLYHWFSTSTGTAQARYDNPPYNNTAVTLSLADMPDEPPFFSAHYWPGTAWFEAPHLARHVKYGEFLVVPGRYAGTGSFVEDRVFMPTMGRGWMQIRAAPLDPDTGAGWFNSLVARLPPGHGIWKGIRVDYATLTGTTPVWRENDGNCCPTGGELSFRLRIAGPDLHLEVADAQFIPPLE